MFELRSNVNEVPEIPLFYTYDDAFDSDFIVFIDDMGRILFVTDNGWAGLNEMNDCLEAFLTTTPEFPVKPLRPDQFIAIR